MRSPDQLTSQTAQDPIEMELLAIQEVAAHPIILETQLVMMGACVLAATLDSLAEAN